MIQDWFHAQGPVLAFHLGRCAPLVQGKARNTRPEPSRMPYVCCLDTHPVRRHAEDVTMRVLSSSS